MADQAPRRRSVFRNPITLISSHPEEVEKSPQLRAIYAHALAASGDMDAGLQQFRTGYDKYRENIATGALEPSSIMKWYGQLFQIYGREGISPA